MRAPRSGCCLVHQDEVGRFESLENGENVAAIHRLAKFKWAGYRYAVISLPGLGPDQVGLKLAPEGQQRTTLAAQNFKAGLAPTILVLGGFVHTAQTLFCGAACEVTI